MVSTTAKVIVRVYFNWKYDHIINDIHLDAQASDCQSFA